MSFKFEPMLATSYNPDKHKNINNWIVTEKLDGIRGVYYDGNFYSRDGNKFIIPPEFTKKLLNIKEFNNQILDGELWISRKNFREIVSLIKLNNKTMEDFKNVKFMIFDIPTLDKPYIDRINYLEKILTKYKDTNIRLVPYTILDNKKDLENKLKDIEKEGGEGLILRDPLSVYENKRSKHMLKVKSSFTDEGICIGFNPGEGKYTGKIGSLKIKWTNPKDKEITFNVSSGLIDSQRELSEMDKFENSIITFAYNELTPKGVPRFPRFIAIRNYE